VSAGAEQSEDNPFARFRAWFGEAEEAEVNDPNAMALATTGTDGMPDVRMVLLKSWDENGFVFFTNSESRKGCELAENMNAAAVLHWKGLRRQVRLRGPVESATAEEADEYYATRARVSQLGAWASRQSRPLIDRSELDAAVARETNRFGAREIPRPWYWNGYRIRPVYLEFWSDRPFRLHDRLVFERDKPASGWRSYRLYP
jgi:pyridoxamine 5'-phosphate oxidase